MEWDRARSMSRDSTGDINSYEYSEERDPHQLKTDKSLMNFLLT